MMRAIHGAAAGPWSDRRRSGFVPPELGTVAALIPTEHRHFHAELQPAMKA